MHIDDYASIFLRSNKNIECQHWKKSGHFIQKNATGVVLVHPSLVRAHATLVYIIYTLLGRRFAQFILM